MISVNCICCPCRPVRMGQEQVMVAVGGSDSVNQPGGSFYGLTRNPNDFGSGGGNSSGNGIGGSGGGLLRLKLSGVLKLEGNY